MPIALVMLQVSAALPPPPIVFDLAKAKPAVPAADCSMGKAGEITVCGKRDPDRYLTKPVAGDYGDKHVSVEGNLPGNVHASGHGEKTPLPGGGPPRFMVTLTKPF